VGAWIDALNAPPELVVTVVAGDPELSVRLRSVFVWKYVPETLNVSPGPTRHPFAHRIWAWGLQAQAIAAGSRSAAATDSAISVRRRGALPRDEI